MADYERVRCKEPGRINYRHVIHALLRKPRPLLTTATARSCSRHRASREAYDRPQESDPGGRSDRPFRLGCDPQTSLVAPLLVSGSCGRVAAVRVRGGYPATT